MRNWRPSTPARAISWLAVGVPALLLLLASLGALTPVAIEGLPQEPHITLVLLPIVRLCRDIAATLAIGFVLVGGLLSPRPDPRMLRAASIAALSWALSLLAFIVLTISELLAFPLRQSIQSVVLVSFTSQTNLGQLLVVQLVCAVLLAVLGWAVLNRITAGIALAIGLVGVCATALTGHSGLHSGHTSASVSLALHIAAAALWVGGLVGAVWIAQRMPTVLARFSTVALICAIVVGESGLLNASLRLAGPAPLLTTTYGAIVLAKVVAFAWLVRFGWLQRTRVVQQVTTQGEAGVRLLLRFSAMEFAVMGGAVALAVTLSRTGAPEGLLPASAVIQGAVASLAIGLGALICLPLRSTASARRVQAVPEFWAILFLVVVLITTGGPWLPNLVGSPMSALLSTAALLGVGTALCLALWSPRGWAAGFVASFGWLAIAAWSANDADPMRWLSVACGIAGLVAIALLAKTRRTTSTPALEGAAL